MKILVTGATGSLGSRLIQAWARTHELTASGRRAFTGPEGVRFVQGDLADPRVALEAVRGQEAVVHCAALASAWGPWEDFYRANVVATENVVNACRLNQVQRLIHISTPSIYFEPRDRLGIRESDPLPPPANHYARSKLMAEEVVRGSGLDSVLIRPRGIFGPTDQVILPKILRLLRKGRFPLVREGRALVDLTHVDNVIHAIELSLAHPGLKGEAIHISNGEPIPVRELVELIADRLDLEFAFVPLPCGLSGALAGFLEGAWKIVGAGGEPPITRYGLGLLSYSQTLDLTKAKELLGFAPIVPLREGLLSTLEEIA